MQKKGRENKEQAHPVLACPSLCLCKPTSFHPGPDGKCSHAAGVHAATVTGVNGGLSSQETRSRNKVVCSHPRASGFHWGRAWASCSFSALRGDTHVRLTQPATGCEHAPLTASERSRGFSRAEFRHTHTHTRVSVHTPCILPLRRESLKS